MSQLRFVPPTKPRVPRDFYEGHFSSAFTDANRKPVLRPNAPDLETRKGRILIVEDELLIAMELEMLVEELGCVPVGPAYDLHSALALVAEVDGAVLDIVLENQTSFAVADELLRLGKPWIFLTGLGGESLKGRYPGVPVITKPCSEQELATLIARIVTADPGGAYAGRS